MAKDVGALRGSMAAVTSKAEAAMATSEALQDEVGRLSEEAHRNAGHLGALATEVRLPSGSFALSRSASASHADCNRTALPLDIVSRSAWLWICGQDGVLVLPFLHLLFLCPPSLSFHCSRCPGRLQEPAGDAHITCSFPRVKSVRL